jgi:hypothetical protein
MADKQCTGDCLKCSFQQQVYCAAQHGHAIMTFIPGIIERLDRIENIFPAMGEVFNPLIKEEAQEDAGAENKASETNQTN